MKRAFVSVIMATYNNAPYLQEAIDSVLKQTYSSFELIIINDASIDTTSQILAAAAKKDHRILIITNESKCGLTESLNAGIEKAQGEYIARIDSDDVWCDAKKLEKQMSFFKDHAEAGIVGCWAYTIDTNGKKIAALQYPVTDTDIRRYLLIENCFIHSGVLIRKSCVDLVGRYDKRLHYAQDYDLWLKIGEKASLYNIPEFMVYYRKNPKGISKTYYKQQLAETMFSVKYHGQAYSFKFISLLFWRIRFYIPYGIREALSEAVRKYLFYNSFHPK